MTEDPNIEWKNKNSGFETKERLTRRINEEEAEVYHFRKKGVVHRQEGIAPEKKPLPLNKIRKKIRNSYAEDEEEDEEYQLIPQNLFQEDFMQNPEDRPKRPERQQQETLEKMHLQKNAGRLQAVETAEKISQSTGIGKIDSKIANRAMMSFAPDEEILRQNVEKGIVKKLRPKERHYLKEKEIPSFFRGVKRIEAIGGKAALKEMKVSEIINAGQKKTKDERIALMLLEKTGRKKTKRTKRQKAKSTSAQKEFNKIIRKDAMLKGLDR